MPGKAALETLDVRLLLINYELPPIGGGGGKATVYLAREFARRGHAVTILSSHFGNLPRSEQSGNLEILRVPVLRRYPDRASPAELLSFSLIGSLAGVELGRKFRPNVVCAFFAFPSGPVAMAIRLVRGIPYVVSLRGSDVPRPQIGHGPLKGALKLMLQCVCRGASAVTAVSEGLREAAVAAVPGLKIEVIFNGVDTDRFVPSHQEAEDVVRVIYVGRLQEFKGVRSLLSAFAIASSRSARKMELEIVGDGPERALLERMAAQLGVQEHVRFSGWVAHERIVEHYQRADMLVLPSLVEGMPNVVLEAMACGIPVIGTDVPGTRELVLDGEVGMLVPPNNCRALADAISELASEIGLRRKMGARARERALAFSWRAAADRYLAIFSAIAAR